MPKTRVSKPKSDIGMANSFTHPDVPIPKPSAAKTAPIKGKYRLPAASMDADGTPVTRLATSKTGLNEHLSGVKRNADLAASAKAQRGFGAQRDAFDAQGGRPGRVDQDIQMLRTRNGGGATDAQAMDIARGTYMHADPGHLGTAAVGSGEKIPRTVRQGTPDITAPHESSPNVVPTRRWEDHTPNEQARILALVKQHGSSLDQMVEDHKSQLFSAQVRSGRNHVQVPFGSRFYEGPSEPHTKLDEGGIEVADRTGINFPQARATVTTGNSSTSPNVKFSQGERYPNHEAAMHAVNHAVDGGSPSTVGRPVGVGGVYPANLEKATHLASQQLAGTPLRELRLPPSKTDPGGRVAFDPKKAPKTTAYVGAWNEPVGPDAMYVSDVHSTHSMMPHLGTAKSVYHKLKDGSVVALHPGVDSVPRGAKVVMTTKENDRGEVKTVPKTGGSQVEDYLASDKVGLAALHDYVARTSAVDVGHSHSINNAGATHFTQAMDWGEEQINRPDIHDRTEKLAYGRPARVAASSGHDIEMRTPASGETVTRTAAAHTAPDMFHSNKYVPPSQQEGGGRLDHFTAGASPTGERLDKVTDIHKDRW